MCYSVLDVSRVCAYVNDVYCVKVEYLLEGLQPPPTTTTAEPVGAVGAQQQPATSSARTPWTQLPLRRTLPALTPEALSRMPTCQS